MHVIVDSAVDLAGALRRAACGRHAEQIEHPDPHWPDWYVQYVVQQQAGHPSQTKLGAGA